MAAEPDHIVIAAGLISLAGNWHESGAWPGENGVTILTATAALTLIFSATRGTVLEEPARGLAGLMLLAALFRYLPAFRQEKGKKAKKNG